MTDKQPMQADGGGTKQRDDGVANPASEGEGSGGAYPNPHSGKEPKGFDGGQSDKAYRGPDNPNATMK
ncbi:hypothetical protein P1X14_00140 [Sphingomonas sp. AOB5]|uniref:hypothetical protein n=1 Tax=Sphingomonas sp. AOB5 TaxID=3034017 RepID=UPI0023F943F0|nr:hypothetical protein [Sphingomonas sp. AOB5]MDF7773640.1 hypothetical protein [Sphingomonas sp. AOB5]